MTASSRRNQLLALVGFAALIVIALIVLSVAGGEDDGSGSLPDAVAETEELLGPIDQRGTALGEPDAPFVLTEFADLQCPFCKQFSEDVFPILVDRFVAPGELRIEFRPLTFLGADSVEAAQMAAAVGLQDQLWSFVDLFYDQQQAEGSGYVDETYLSDLAEALPGVDAERALAERGSPGVDAVLADAESLAREFAIESTPSFLFGRAGAEARRVEADITDPQAFVAVIEQLMDADGG
jgi:protein-disulfide isomerase